MSKHFRSILRLVSDDGVAPVTQGGERLSIGFNSSSKTVTFPEQPRPPFAEGKLAKPINCAHLILIVVFPLW